MISTVTYRGQGAPVFVEGGACAMAQWPVQVWVSCLLWLDLIAQEAK